MDYVASTFRDHQHPDPRLNNFGKTSRLLSKQYKGYKNEDKPIKQQKALPLCIIKNLAKNKSTKRAKAIGDLAIMAFFFAMRSCKHLKVTEKEEDRKKKRLRIRNFCFFQNGRELPKKVSTLQSADYVFATFEDQKNNNKYDTITMHNSGEKLLCLVRSIARIIQHILKHSSSNEDMYINSFRSCSKTHEVSGEDMKHALRAAAFIFGKDKLGFNTDEIGTHSIRSGAAMAMYLDKVPVYTIMLIGRWSSDAFLKYIRKQVEQFSHNVSKRMIKHQYMTHVPDKNPRVSIQDPRQRNCRNNSQTRLNMGSALNHVIPILPRMSLWS